MRISLSNPAFPDELIENFPSESSKQFQLPLEIIDRQLQIEEYQSFSTDIKKITPSSSPLPHSRLDTNDRECNLNGMCETSQSSADIDNMLRSWGSDHFKISPSSPNNVSPYERNHRDQVTTVSFSGMKRSPLCSDLRCLDNSEFDGESIDNESDHFQKKRRSIDIPASDIDNRQFEFESTLFF